MVNQLLRYDFDFSIFSNYYLQCEIKLIHQHENDFTLLNKIPTMFDQ